MFWKFRLCRKYKDDPKRLIEEDEAVSSAKESGSRQVYIDGQKYEPVKLTIE